MPKFGEMSLDRFIGELAYPAPTPGGGTAAAVTAAIAAALIGMVTSISLKKGHQDPDLAGARARADVLRKELLALADRDAAAYGRVVEAYKLPGAEREARALRIQEALREAAGVPLETAERAAEVLELAARVAGRVRPAVLSDVLVAARLAHAGAHAALYNVDVNLSSLKNGEVKQELGRRRREIAERAEGLWRGVSALEERLG